jgi:hypothetical protein
MALSVFGPTDLRWEETQTELVMTLGTQVDAHAAARKAVAVIASSRPAASQPAARADEMRLQAHLLRDIFGNPFRPVVLNTSGLTASTRALANTIYEERRFLDLPKLARALKQDVGCADQDLHDHCQWPIPHVRGCWVVDLVLKCPR